MTARKEKSDQVFFSVDSGSQQPLDTLYNQNFQPLTVFRLEMDRAASQGESNTSPVSRRFMAPEGMT